MKIIGLDFETYYHAQDFTLSKTTTEAYIRDPQFEVIGVALQTEGERPRWFSGTKPQIKEFLESWKLEENIALAHNAAFDMAILNWHFGIKPKRIADTLSMARAIHGTEVGGSLAALALHYGVGVKGEEVGKVSGMRRIDFDEAALARYGSYCENDVELTLGIFEKMVGDFDISELRLIDLTIRMFSEPVLRLDQPLLELYLMKIKQDKSDLLDTMPVGKEQLMSNPKLADVLRSLGVEPPMKTSPTTGKETYAFAKSDEEFKALLEHENVMVQNIVSARLGIKSTLEETRAQRFIDVAGRGLLPVPLRYYAARTGRWGGCLVADTGVLVYNIQNGVESKRIVDVLLDDLVWDGEAFVPHEGVVFSGYSEVIEWDGVKGTEDHVVFTDAGETSLRGAMQGAHRITPAGSPTQNDVDAAGVFMQNHPR